MTSVVSGFSRTVDSLPTDLANLPTKADTPLFHLVIGIGMK